MKVLDDSLGDDHPMVAKALIDAAEAEMKQFKWFTDVRPSEIQFESVEEGTRKKNASSPSCLLCVCVWGGYSPSRPPVLFIESAWDDVMPLRGATGLDCAHPLRTQDRHHCTHIGTYRPKIAKVLPNLLMGPVNS